VQSKNGQSSETYNIGYKTQNEDKKTQHRKLTNRNYSAILATLQITSYALGV